MLDYFSSKTTKFIIISFFIVLTMPLWGCEEKMGANVISVETDMKIIQDEAIEAFTGKKIFFGHMSVGYNIINGIEDIKTASKRFSKIRIEELVRSELANEPGIYHAKVGENGFPEKKCDAFKKRLMEDSFGSRVGIAFFKFCYVDFKESSDVKEIFSYYTKTADYLKKEFPQLQILHVTTPLTVHAPGLKGFVKSLLKDDIANIKRNEFNSLLIDKYKNIDPIYDLAKAESTLPDGERVTFRHKGSEYFSLAGQYTDDGGHLNKLGRYCAARELLITLSHISN